MLKEKRNIYIIISLVFILLFRFIPSPEGLNSSAMNIVGIFIGTLILWLTISIDWPSIICLAALSFVPEIGATKLFARSFGSTTFSFLMFTFMATYAVSKTPFIRRCALAFINSKMSRKGPWYFTVLFLFSCIVLGSFMSPSVLFVIYLPIIKEIFNLLDLKKDDKSANMLMIGMAISIAISSGMTPIAHIFSIMAIGFYEAATSLTISHFDYMLFAIPVGLICFIIMILIFKYIYRPDMSKFEKVKQLKFEKNIGMEKREIITIIIFIFIIILWVLPGLIKSILPGLSNTIPNLGSSVPPLIGVSLMFIITIDKKPLLEFKEVMTNGVSWASLVMTASTLAIGFAMTNKEIGLTDFMIEKSSIYLQDLSPLLLVLVFTLWAAFQTNASSNMVTVTVVSAVALPLAVASNGAVNPASIASIIGMMGAFAFATPPSHPNIALAISSGYTNGKQMLIFGSVMMVVSVLVTVFVGYPLSNLIM